MIQLILVPNIPLEDPDKAYQCQLIKMKLSISPIMHDPYTLRYKSKHCFFYLNNVGFKL